MKNLLTLPLLLATTFLKAPKAAAAESNSSGLYHARFVLGNGKTAQETSDYVLDKARELIHRVQVYTHDYTKIPIPVNPRFVHAVQDWVEEYDKQQQQQVQQHLRKTKAPRQDDGDEEEFTAPVRSPSIVRVAADVLLAVVGNRTDSIFNLTHQIQNVGKFVVNPVQGISGLAQNVNRFLGIGQKSGEDAAAGKGSEAESSQKISTSTSTSPDVVDPLASASGLLTKARKIKHASDNPVRDDGQVKLHLQR